MFSQCFENLKVAVIFAESTINFYDLEALPSTFKFFIIVSPHEGKYFEIILFLKQNIMILHNYYC